IRFAALSFASAYRNEYFYKLDGVDTEWRSVSGQNPHVSYSLLPAGKYRLSVKASNNDGVLNEEPIYLDIQVSPNAYNTAILILGMLLGGGILIAFLLRNTSYMGDKDKKKKSRPIILEANEEDKAVIKALESLMKTEMLYLDPELGLNALAQRLDVTPNHLSMLLNDH